MVKLLINMNMPLINSSPPINSKHPIALKIFLFIATHIIIDTIFIVIFYIIYPKAGYIIQAILAVILMFISLYLTLLIFKNKFVQSDALSVAKWVAIINTGITIAGFILASDIITTVTQLMYSFIYFFYIRFYIKKNSPI